MKLFIYCLVLIFFSIGSLFPMQQVEKKEPPRKVVTAVRLVEPVKIDGILSENVWQGPGYSKFIQSDPLDGQPATEKTLVWVAYDKNAIYVAARMYDRNPEKLICRLGRRDSFIDSEWFIFYLDPYFDKRSGYSFGINCAGSICDWAISNDEFKDSSWDAVWSWKTRIDESGWTLEARIPFTQLRFKKKKNGKQVWGVNFRRYIKHKNEVVSYSWKPKTVAGEASHFAILKGMKNIKHRKQIEALPYLVGKATYDQEEEGNPFQTGEDYSLNAGLDLKVGLKSNLTLDLSINPDFGQVEVDPAVINLSAAESYYQEKRPFFIEGAGTFRFGVGGSTQHWGANWSSPSFFYSRRIGRPPQGSADTSGYTSYPEWSTILASGKITGKIGRDWNIGFLTAFTGREYVKINDQGKESRQEVEPFTNYTVLRIQKEFNEGRQGLGFLTTGVLRNLRSEDMRQLLNNEAFALAIDGWSFLDKGKTWVVSGWLGGTSVTGTPDKIWDIQNSYPHYFQRPDVDHLDPDPSRTSLSGLAGRFTLNKQKGNFLVNTALGFISPGFHSMDLGFQSQADMINGHIALGYRSYKPGKIIRNWNVLLFTQRNYDFGGNKIGEQRLIALGGITFKNYWSVNFQLSYNPGHLDKDMTRGGPFVETLPYTWFEFGFGTDNRKALTLGGGIYALSSTSGTRMYMGGLGIEWKPSSNFNISINPDYQYRNFMAQWVTNVEDPYKTETFGTRYVYGAIDQKTLSCSIRLNWIFSPRLSLQAYIQPFISVGDYTDFKELARPSTYVFDKYEGGNSTLAYQDEVYTVDPDGAGPAAPFSFDNPDFNYKSLRGTIVLRWEYRPGSTIYAVWTQNRSDFANPGEFRFGRDFSNLFSAPGDNIFMFKFTYRFQI